MDPSVDQPALEQPDEANGPDMFTDNDLASELPLGTQIGSRSRSCSVSSSSTELYDSSSPFDEITESQRQRQENDGYISDSRDHSYFADRSEDQGEDTEEHLDTEKVADEDPASFQTTSTRIIEGGFQLPHRPAPRYPLHETGFNCNGRLPSEDPRYGNLEEMEEEATQPSTQPMLDPRRLGLNNSGLSEQDLRDVICVLHPNSVAAHRAIAAAAHSSPQHILQNSGLSMELEDPGLEPLEATGTAEMQGNRAQHPTGEHSSPDIALRLSSRVHDYSMGFVFGRNPARCDIVLGNQSEQKRVSNVHFRIYVKFGGIPLLEDTSTNGTVVDDKLLKARDAKPNEPTRQMLINGSIIRILSNNLEDEIKFIVRLPNRHGYMADYEQRVSEYIQRIAHYERAVLNAQGQLAATAAMPFQGRLARDVSTPPAQTPPAITRYVADGSSTHGCIWDGGDQYNVVQYLGKGAFANVYKVATKIDGELFAAKEIEKRKFMKNGILDGKVENEVKIMKGLRHPHIVQYIDYVDMPLHLYIVMEYVACGDLARVLSEGGILTEPLARSMTSQILSALEYLHHMKVTHRDIKPDNILIACNDPFHVKLSDFGLSKAVNDDTFLTTFCGTLLYCAPEVFPDYNAFATGRPIVGRRHGHHSRDDEHHVYNQSVDIWSYGAVLFHTMTGKVPYPAEPGDHVLSGRPMLSKIMKHTVDSGPLIQRGISHAGIDFLLGVLNRIPSQRPSATQCLQHCWITGCEDPPLEIQNGRSGVEPNADREQYELDASQLSIQESVSDNDKKRVFLPGTGENAAEPLQYGEHAALDSNAFASYNGQSFSDYQFDDPQPARPRLFGEIGESALRSSGVFGRDVNRALDPTGRVDEDTPSSVSSHSSVLGFQLHPSQNGDNNDLKTGAPNNPRVNPRLGPAASLLGAEDLVHALKMNSPELARSFAPRPKMPLHHESIIASKHPRDTEEHEKTDSVSKRSKFSRRIAIQPPASSWYEADDPSTHTLEYASRKSGINYLAQGAQSTEQLGSKAIDGAATVPAKTFGQFGQGQRFITDNNDKSFPLYPPSAHLNLKGDMTELNTPDKSLSVSSKASNALSRGIVGKLTSLPGSIADVTLNLHQRKTTWGRSRDSTIVYPHPEDVRIPRNALEIDFWCHEAEDAERNGEDWAQLKCLQAIIRTRSKAGIWINGIHMSKEAKNGFICGMLYTGDVISVCEDTNKKEYMRFRCKFYVGDSASPRPAGEPRFLKRIIQDGFEEWKKWQAETAKEGQLGKSATHSPPNGPSNPGTEVACL
ncbi:MAG: hypothetical protein M1819_004924 [Sarea resinae]|nr:MAG: hypothetical protein M1819_004924 [Sarea resinae]